MNVKIINPIVFNGSIQDPGTWIQLPYKKARALELAGMVERHPDEWQDDPVISPDARPINDVLIFTPVLRLEAETVQALMALEWDGPVSFLLQRDNPTGDGKKDHLHQYRRARKTFLQGPWDAMLIIESDLVPPPDTLKKLAALQSDCSYGVYRFRVSNVINIFEKYPGKSKNLGQSLSIKKPLLKRAVALGKYPCSGAGLGCILIRRQVLESLDFRLERNMAHCDTYFNQDVLQAGFTQMADFTVICGHKDLDGVVLWPEL